MLFFASASVRVNLHTDIKIHSTLHQTIIILSVSLTHTDTEIQIKVFIVKETVNDQWPVAPAEHKFERKFILTLCSE